MKLLSFVIDGRPGYGAVKDHAVVDLGARFGAQGCLTLRQLLEAGRLPDAAKVTATEPADHALDNIAFAPVIPDPGKIICVGLNYRDHVAETGRTVTVGGDGIPHRIITISRSPPVFRITGAG